MPKRERTPQTDKTDKNVPIMMRLPEDLHLWLKTMAEIEHRSLNSQVIVLLQKSRNEHVHGYQSKSSPSSVNDIGIASAQDPGEPKNSL